MRKPTNTRSIALALLLAGSCGKQGDASRRADESGDEPRPRCCHDVAVAPVDVPKAHSLPQPDLPMPGPKTEKLLVQDRTLEGRLLVVAADGSEPALEAITQILGYLGTPYDLEVATGPSRITPDRLARGSHARYQGVVLTTGSLAYDTGSGYASALDEGEWQALWDFEAAFGVRQVTWYTYPTPAYGFGEPRTQDTSVTPLVATLTAEGRAVFPYVNAAVPVVVENAWAYAAPAEGASVTPLLMTQEGEAVAAVTRYPDGRENLAMTFDAAPFLVHGMQLAYGAIRWVTRGVFLGERHVYVGAQVDDVFLETDLFMPDGSEATYRMTGADLEASLAWQNGARQRPTGAELVLDMAYNGEGASAFSPDTLTPTARALEGEFKWISHTYTHLNLNEVDYDAARFEIAANVKAAKALDLSLFDKANLVTPQVSGLYNPEAMKAAADVGVRYVVSDTSRPGEDNPSPNAGIRNALQPEILEIPRRPTNLFYNVSTPEEWTAEYNSFHRAYWGRDLSYEEILDKESEILLRYLLRHEIDPWMFHQANLRAYDGQRTLLTDLLDVTFDKYEALYTLPIKSPTMDELGRLIERRMAYDASGARAVIRPGVSVTISVERGAVVPVTGVQTKGSELYGDDWISYVALKPGEPKTLTLH